MNEASENHDEAMELIEVLCQDRMTAEGMARLESLVLADPVVRSLYVHFLHMHASLPLFVRDRTDGAAQPRDDAARFGDSGNLGPMESTEDLEDLLAVVEEALFKAAPTAGGLPECTPFAENRGQRRSPTSLAALGFLRRIGRPLRRYRGDPRFTLATVWVFTLLFAAGAAGIVAALTTMFRGGSAPGDQAVSDQPPVVRSPLAVTDGPVAHLARTVDCAWAADAEAPQVGDELAGGRRLSLKSGLAEIDFLDGARLLLQGPATLEVRSCAGAILSRGKCSVTVEEPKARGFIVQTPGMAYTDLGTEFGVLVAQGGEQEVQVFRGKVQADELAEERSATRKVGHSSALPSVQSANGSDSSHPPSPIAHHATVVLSAHQAIRVAAPGAAGSSTRPIELIAADDKQFVREMPKTLDLADIVAGGDGTSGKSGRGLDPLTGNPTEMKVGPNIVGSRDYHKVTAVKFIDGVFVPDGRDGSVQLDSAGHNFALPKTCGRTDHVIFAETVEALASTQRAMSLSRTPLVDNLSAALTRSHPQLYMHANAGITFDLEAIRASQAGCRPTRFQTMVCTERSGQPAAAMSAWVFLDGQLCFQRQSFHLRDGYFGIDIPVPPGARFLTLVATDADMDINSDHVIFHCPQLVMEAAND